MERHERLKIFIEEQNIKQKEFAEILDSTQQYVSALLNGKRKLGTNILERIESQFKDLNIHWLLTGEGEMLKGDEKIPVKNAILEGNSREEEPRYPELDLETVRNEIRSDLKVILDGMTENFRVVHKSAKQMHQDHQKILRFIEDLDKVKFLQAAKEMDEFLKERK